MINAVVLMKIRNDRINEVAESMLELKGVSEVHSVAGQYDLVAILRAPDDEGIAAVVTENILKIEGLITQLKKDYTIVIVTHNMEQATRCSDRTAFLYMGKLVEYGDTMQLFENPREADTEAYITGRFS